MIGVAGNGHARESRLLPMLLVGNGIIGGMEEYVLSLLRCFREMGQRALVGAPFIGDFTAAALEQGHPARDLLIFEMSDAINVAALAQLTAFIKARRVSLVHTHLQPADTLGAAAAAHAGVPALSTLHGLRRCKEELLLRALYGIDFVAVSQAGRASAIEKGLPPDAVACIPNGVDTRRFDPALFDREAMRRVLGLAPDQVLVTCVSRLAHEKHPEGFVRAAELSAAADPRIEFALVGTGPLESKLHQMVAAGRAAGRIRLLGARRDIPEILAASDVAALTSRTESLPFSVLEAMAMALPVVSHDVGGVGEVLEDGSDGFLVPFGRPRRFAAALLRLAADPGLRERMGRAGRAKVLGRLDSGRNARSLLQLYRVTAERHASGERGAPRLSMSAPEIGPREGRAAAALSPPGLEGGNAREGRRLTLLRDRGLGSRVEQMRQAARKATTPPVVDAHLHLSGGETTAEVLRTLDEAGVACACLIAPFIDRETWSTLSGDRRRRANAELAELAAGAPQRLWGLVGIDPVCAGAAREVEKWGTVEGIRGVKLIPQGWSPAGPDALIVYEACEAAGLPILFHSGIFISGRSSDLCRPALYEAVRRFPGLRVVLAHLSWPWVDEAVAVAFMDLLKGLAPQISLDLSPGTPPAYRMGALRRAFRVLGASALIFGSDRFLPVDPNVIAGHLTDDFAALRSLGAGAEDLRRIFHANAAALFAPALAPSPAVAAAL